MTSRTRLVAAFVAVVTCLVLVDALVLLAVLPQLRALRAITDDHGRTVDVTTEIRAGISAARRALLDAAEGRRSAQGTSAEAVARLEALARRTEALVTLAGTAGERDDAAALGAALAGCAEAAREVSTRLGRGDSAAAGRATEGFLDRAREATEAADQIVTRNVGALETARRSADRLRETVDGLLEFARAGVAAREVGPADLGRVLGEVREELAPHLASSHLAMEVEVPPGTTVAMATSHLATVMRNLVGNAAKYAGGADGARVTIRATANGAGVHVEVEDNGPGIAPDALPRVFEPFVRATTVGHGHGLGLATVRRLVEAHRGAVRISSEPGHGTTIELDLPTQAARAADDARGATR